MEVKVLESPGAEWDEFAARYTDLIFYRSTWSEVLRRGLGGQSLYFYLTEGGEIRAGLPGVLLNFRIFKVFYASIPYGNLVGEKAYFEIFMDLFRRKVGEIGIDQVRLTDSPFFESYRPGSYQSVPGKCTLLSLAGKDQDRLFEGYKKNIRRDIRKAQRSGVHIRVGTSREDVKRFYGLYLLSMERNRAAAKYPYRWFEALFDEMIERHGGAVLLAGLNGKEIAGAVLIDSAGSSHYLHSGSDPGFLKFCPNELLIHSALVRAVEKGASVFDFMGSDPADLPLIRYKEKWGGRSLDLYTHIKNCHPFKCRLWELGEKMGEFRFGEFGADDGEEVSRR